MHRTAFNQTEDLPRDLFPQEFPKRATTWSLVSTHGTITYIHSDSQGVGTADSLGIRLPIDFAIFYQIAQSTSGTESYSECFTLIASILHKIVSSKVSEQT